MTNKIGLLFSHMHVREHEQYKFDILDYCINYYKNLDNDFFYVISGHGIDVPTTIKQKINALYWEPLIDSNEIGRGHPKFCINGYNLLARNNVDFSIKLRASDMVLNIDEIISNRQDSKIILSEQTSLDKKMIGDLFMAGPTGLVRDLWMASPWDYSKSGLYNLFDNATLLANRSNVDVTGFFEQNCIFLSPHEINWVTLDNNWNISLKSPHRKVDSSDIWGIKQGYQHYGGF